jgi:hypothetical protein
VKVRSFQLRLWDISSPLTPAPSLNRAKALILERAVSRYRKDSPKEKFRVVTNLYEHVSAFGVNLLNKDVTEYLRTKASKVLVEVEVRDASKYYDTRHDATRLMLLSIVKI